MDLNFEFLERKKYITNSRLLRPRSSIGAMNRGLLTSFVFRFGEFMSSLFFGNIESDQARMLNSDLLTIIIIIRQNKQIQDKNLYSTVPTDKPSYKYLLQHALALARFRALLPSTTNREPDTQQPSSQPASRLSHCIADMTTEAGRSRQCQRNKRFLF